MKLECHAQASRSDRQQHNKGCRLAIPVYLEAALQRVAQVLCDFVYADASHGSDSQRPDQGIGVLRVLQSQIIKGQPISTYTCNFCIMLVKPSAPVDGGDIICS